MARVDSEQESGRNFPKILGPLMNKVIYLEKNNPKSFRCGCAKSFLSWLKVQKNGLNLLVKKFSLHTTQINNLKSQIS